MHDIVFAKVNYFNELTFTKLSSIQSKFPLLLLRDSLIVVGRTLINPKASKSYVLIELWDTVMFSGTSVIQNISCSAFSVDPRVVNRLALVVVFFSK